LKPAERVLTEWEREFGIDGVSGPTFSAYLDEVWQKLRVNATESQRNANNQVLWDGCRSLGYSEGVDYRVIERNAVGCQQRCDFCTYGCIYACKQSTALTCLPSAQARGARFLFDTRVERVVIDGGLAKGVSAIFASGGRTHRVDVAARAVVVACGGIETPALLLRSGVKDDNVGKYLRLDPTVAVGGVFEKTIDPWRGPPQTVAVWKFIDLDGTYHGFWIEAAPAHPGLFALSVPWVNGRQHKEFMKQNYAHSSASIILLRERSSGRVSIGKDGYPRVSYELERSDRETLVKGMEETARILIAAGAVGVWTTHNDPVFAGDGKTRLKPEALDGFGRPKKKGSRLQSDDALQRSPDGFVQNERGPNDRSYGSDRGTSHRQRTLRRGRLCLPYHPSGKPHDFDHGDGPKNGRQGKCVTRRSLVVVSQAPRK
jgi:hypothetical protein